jgi:hypothetical protein
MQRIIPPVDIITQFYGTVPEFHLGCNIDWGTDFPDNDCFCPFNPCLKMAASFHFLSIHISPFDPIWSELYTASLNKQQTNVSNIRDSEM